VINDFYQRTYDKIAPAVARNPIWKRLTRTAFSAKVTKYALSSVFAFAISNIAFAFFYWANFSTTVCSIVGFVVAAIPNWIMNRRWAWQQGGRPPVRQFVSYAIVSIAVLVASSLVTGFTNKQVQSVPQHYGLRLLIVTGSYILVTVFFFVLKFVIYEYYVFAERRRAKDDVTSLRQVSKMARANRMP